MEIKIGKKYKEREGGDIIIIIFDFKSIHNIPENHPARFLGISTKDFAYEPNNFYRTSYNYDMTGKMSIADANEYDLIEEIT